MLFSKLDGVYSMPSMEVKEMPHFIQVFVYSGILNHFTEVGPGIIHKFHTAILGIIHLQTLMDSYSANYIMWHEKVTADDKLT